MTGAIIEDIVGSRFEFCNYLSKDFEFFHRDCAFTDDTVMTCAAAQRRRLNTASRPALATAPESPSHSGARSGADTGAKSVRSPSRRPLTASLKAAATRML